MKRSHLMIIAAVAPCFAGLANAQTADDGLAAAFATCHQHWKTTAISVPNAGPAIAQGWEKGWEQCQRIIQDAYQKSAPAAQVDAERQRMLDLVKKLPN